MNTRIGTDHVLCLAAVALLSVTACTPASGSSDSMRVLTSTLPDATLSEPYNQAMIVEGGRAPITFGLYSGQLPPGMSSTGNGIFGTPTALGTYSFVMKATDADELLVAVPLSIRVRQPGLGMKLGTSNLPVATLNQKYTGAIAVTGGTRPYKFQRTSGKLPNGLTLDGVTGVIAGTPTEAGAFGLMVKITDATLQYMDRQLSLTVVTGSTADLSPSLIASTTSGVAPLSVFFDATATTSKKYPKSFHHVAYDWNFGDAGSRRPLSSGPVAAHVFEGAGTYRIQLTVTQPDGKTAVKTVSVTVVDQDAAFLGPNTIVFSNTKDFTGAPKGAQQVTTTSFDAAMGSFQSGMRLLFKRGDTFSNTKTQQISASKPSVIGAFGKGTTPDSHGIFANNPKIVSSNSAFPVAFRGSDLCMQDLTCSDSAGNAHAVFSNSRRISRVLMLRLKATGYDSPFGFGQGIIEYYKLDPHELVTVADCFSYKPRGYGIYAAGKRIAFLGNTVERSQSTHLMRVLYTIGCVIDRNRLLYPGGTRHALKLHKEATASRYGQYSKSIVIRENEIKGTTPWLVTLGPQDSGSNEEVRDVIVEKNRITSDAGVQVDLYINSALTTIRNNIFFNAAATSWTKYCILVTRRGIEPVPFGVEVYNNTYYNSIKGVQEDYLLSVDNHQGAVIVKNNLLYAPQSSTRGVARGKATLLSVSGNMENKDPKFLNASQQDFRLGAGSPALKVGDKTVPVVDDFRGTLRPTSGSAPDVGAFQK